MSDETTTTTEATGPTLSEQAAQAEAAGNWREADRLKSAMLAQERQRREPAAQLSVAEELDDIAQQITDAEEAGDHKTASRLRVQQVHRLRQGNADLSDLQEQADEAEQAGDWDTSMRVKSQMLQRMRERMA